MIDTLLRYGTRSLVDTRIEDLPGYVQEPEFVDNWKFPPKWNPHDVMRVKRRFSGPFQNLFAFEPLVEPRNKKCSRLRFEAVEHVLWLHDENSKEVPPIDLRLEVGTLVTDKGV